MVATLDGALCGCLGDSGHTSQSAVRLLVMHEVACGRANGHVRPGCFMPRLSRVSFVGSSSGMSYTLCQHRVKVDAADTLV
jgi:hypothetical protein